jgi:hypothetical protein
MEPFSTTGTSIQGQEESLGPGTFMSFSAWYPEFRGGRLDSR